MAAPEPGDLRARLAHEIAGQLASRLSVLGSVAVRWLVNPVTSCDDHGVFFVAASGQIRLAVATLAAFLPVVKESQLAIRHTQGEPWADLGSRGLLEALWVEPSVEGGDCRVGLATRPCGKL